jgi:hypothetical protein
MAIAHRQLRPAGNPAEYLECQSESFDGMRGVGIEHDLQMVDAKSGKAAQGLCELLGRSAQGLCIWSAIRNGVRVVDLD